MSHRARGEEWFVAEHITSHSKAQRLRDSRGSKHVWDKAHYNKASEGSQSYKFLIRLADWSTKVRAFEKNVTLPKCV